MWCCMLRYVRLPRAPILCCMRKTTRYPVHVARYGYRSIKHETKTIKHASALFVPRDALGTPPPPRRHAHFTPVWSASVHPPPPTAFACLQARRRRTRLNPLPRFTLVAFGAPQSWCRGAHRRGKGNKDSARLSLATKAAEAISPRTTMPRASQQALAPRNRLQKILRCAVPATEFEFRGHDTPLSAPGVGSKKKGSPQHILRTASLLTTRATDCEHAKPTSQTRAVIRRRAMSGKTGVPDARMPRKRPNQENEGVPSLGSRESQLHVQPAPFRTEPSGKKSIGLAVDDALNQSLCDARLQGSRALKQHPVWRGQHLQRRTSLRLQNALQKVLQQPQPPRLLQRAQMRPPFSRATKSKASVRAQTSPRRKGKTRDTDAKQKCPSTPMSAFDDSTERLPTLTESINEKTNKWSLSEPLLLQASMLFSSLTLFLWGSWSTKFSREASQRPEISVSRDWTSPPPAAAAPTTSARAERARRRTWHIPAQQKFQALCERGG